MSDRMSFFELWDTVISSALRKNSSMSGDIKFEPFYCDEVGFYNSAKGISYLYTLDGYPKELETALRYYMRSECKGDTRISFISLLERHKIDWDSNAMTVKLRAWKILDESTGDVDEYNMHENISAIDNVVWRKNSLMYLNDAVLRRKRKVFRYRTLVIVTGVRGKDFDESVEQIDDYCKQRGIQLTRVLYNVQDYLSMYSPFKLSRNVKLEKEIGNVVLTDELLARFTTFSQGKIGKKGVYWGTDIFSCFASLKPVKVKATDSETWLVTGETGSGKSYFIKGLGVQLLALPVMNGTINDVEGDEYLDFVDLVQTDEDRVVVLNMSEGQGLYADPVPIITTGIKKLDVGMYAMSVSFTTTMFRTLVGDVDSKIQVWVEVIIDEAVSRMYTKVGVNENLMSTWKKASESSIFDVYNDIKSMLVNRDEDSKLNSIFSNEDYLNALQVVVARLSRYFEDNGTRRGTFNKKVSLTDIANAKLVINSFGMAGKSPNTVDPTQMALMQMYAAYISFLRSVFSKAAGKFNFKVWEEFQRWGSFKDSEKIITTALTGGRKLGDINLIATNKVGDLLEDDKFGIFSNLSSVAIGCIWDAKVRSDLCKRLSMTNFEEDLNTLVSKNKSLVNYVDGDTVQDSAYNKAFLIGLDKAFYTIVKMDLPEELDSMSLFQTGVVLKAEE